MDDLLPVPKVSESIGARFREIRKEQGFTLEDFADVMRSYGFRWSTSRVIEFETGKVSPTIGLVAAVASALNELCHTTIPATALLHGYGPVEIAPGVVVEISALADVIGVGGNLVTADRLQSARVSLRKHFDGDEDAEWLRGEGWTPDRQYEAIAMTQLADERAARSLRLTVNQLATAAVTLWGRALTAERDAHVEPSMNAQAIGRVTRGLIDQISDYVERKRDHA